MIFVDTSGESLRKMQNSGNSVGGQSEFTGHHFNSKIKRPDGVHGVLLHHKTASEQSLLTFAIAAEETEYVHISECPVFVISGSHKGISAKDMWHEVKQKFLMFIAKPLAKLGTCVEMLVNLIALNGGIIMIIINFLSVPSEPGSSIGAAIAATVTIPPDAQHNVTFSLAWDSPEVMFPGGPVYNKLVVENVNKKVSCLKTIQN